MEFEQIKTGIGNYTPIDEDTINKIACIKAFNDAGLNKMLWEHHKELLRYARDKNENKEVGFFLDLSRAEIQCIRIRGAINGFSIHDDSAVFRLMRNPYNIRNVIVMHNHPRNGLFSGVDIKSFTDFNAVYIMTAVCNDGTIYMLRKEDNFNPILMSHYYNEGAKRSKIETENELIKKAKKLKINLGNPMEREKLDNITTKPYYYGIKNVAKHSKEIGVTYRCSVKRK